MTSTIISASPAVPQSHNDQESSQFIDADSMIDHDEKNLETEDTHDELDISAHNLSDTDETRHSVDQKFEINDDKELQDDNKVEDLVIPHSSSFAKGIKDQLRSDLSMTKSKSINSFQSAQSQTSPKPTTSPKPDVSNNPNLIDETPSADNNYKFLNRSISVSSSSKSNPSTSSPLVSKTNALATLTKSSENQNSSDLNKKRLSSYIEHSSDSEKQQSNKVPSQFQKIDESQETQVQKKKKEKEFNEDFNSKPEGSVTPRSVVNSTNLTPNSVKRRSFFSFNHNNTSKQSISSPVLLEGENTNNSEIYSAFRVPEQLSNDKSFNSNLPKKNYIDINKEKNDYNNKNPDHRKSVASSPALSSISPPDKKKSRNSLMSFFKYKKSVSTNNLNGNNTVNDKRRSGSLPMMKNSVSHMDLRTTSNNQKKDSMSIKSAFNLRGNGHKSSRNNRSGDDQSIGSNLTSRTSLSNFRNSIFGKLRNKNSSSTLNSSSSSLFGMNFHGNSSSRQRNVSSNANRVHSTLGNSVAYGGNEIDHNDNSDAVSIKTSNTANFNLAIKNKLSKNSKNSPQTQTGKNEFDNYDSIGKNSTNVKSPTETIKNDNNDELPVIKTDQVPFNNEILQSLESLNLAPFSEGEILFPKSLDPEEVNNIVQIERSLSTRSTSRAESIKKKNSISKRASIEVKAKEDGMTVIEGGTMDPMVNNNRLSVGGVGIAGMARTPSLKKTSSILKKNTNVIKEDIVHEVESPVEKNHGDDLASRRVSQSMVDFGISFSDTNLDLDFPGFAESKDKVGGNSVFDDMSSKSFESDDENEILIQKPENGVSPRNPTENLNKNYSFPANKNQKPSTLPQQVSPQPQQQTQREQQSPQQKQNKNTGFRSYFNKGKLNYLTGNNKSDSQLSLSTPSNVNNKHLAVPATSQDHRKTQSTASTMSVSSFASANSNMGNLNVPIVQKKGVFLQLSTSSHSLVNKSSNLNNAKVKFSSKIILYETYNPEDYDRHPEIATCNQLTPLLAQQIKEELNSFKAEMPIHEDSRCNTHFF